MSSMLHSNVAKACNEAVVDSEGNSTKGNRKQKMDFTQGFMEIRREEIDFNRQKYVDEKHEQRYKDERANKNTKNDQKFTMTLQLIQQGKTPEEIEAYLKIMNF